MISNCRNRFNRKAAIELSVNMLVIITISLVMLGLGVSLLYKFIGSSIERKGELDLLTQQELQRLLIDEGKKLALPLHIANLNAGKSHVFAIGILNMGSGSDEFYLNIKLDQAFDQSNKDITAVVNPQLWLLYTNKVLKIKEGEHHTEPIMVDVPNDAKKGKYIFNVKVYKDSDYSTQYENTQKFIVNVG